MSNDDDDFLYDDLQDAQLAKKQKTTTTTTVAKKPSAAATDRPLSLSEQAEQHQKRVEQLERENEQLKRNIGTLYRTAKKEIQRKDNQIARLMKELDDAKRWLTRLLGGNNTCNNLLGLDPIDSTY